MLLRILLPRIIVVASLLCLPLLSQAENKKTEYSPSKVVYDLSSSDPDVLQNILDRISMLQNVYNNDPFEASIVVVIHEGTIPLFVAKSSVQKSNKKAREKIENLMLRAESLTSTDIIKFRVCKASAAMQGFVDSDFPGFTAMVPMADAEIIKLQGLGYAYLK